MAKKMSLTGAARRVELCRRLDALYDARSDLAFKSRFELLVAVILSAQATDKQVNKVTRVLYERANTPQAILALGLDGLQEAVKSIGLFRAKAKNIIKTCRILIEEHGGEVPEDRAALEALPGVGQKTAGVVLNVGFGHPTIPVDTHVFRVSHRLHLSRDKSPEKTEATLERVIPEAWRNRAHHLLILHGRYVCKARKPRCELCIVRDLCRSRERERGLDAPSEVTWQAAREVIAKAREDM